MPSPFLPHSSKASVEFKSYSEKRDYSTEGNPEPNGRSQTLIYQRNGSQWWIKVTFRGDVYSILNMNGPKGKAGPKTTKRNRREEFQAFVRLIDYSTLPLLDDTVTELILEEELSGGHGSRLIIHADEESNNNPFMKTAAKLKWTVQEDPSRVVYPLCDEFLCFRSIDLTEFSDQSEIADGVFRVLNANNTPYILKVVNRPLYQPYDTEVIRKELENLAIFQNVPHVVQAVGIAVSANPYMTSSTRDQSLVVMGIILEYYSGGSLQTILSENRLLDFAWERWALQIATALVCFHMAGKKHMDIKLANVVLDADGNAVLIDISGIGGITHGWCAPEIQNEILPSKLPFTVRRSNDTWAYGKLLSNLVLHAGDSPFVRLLEKIAGDLMVEETHERMTLSEAIPKLERAGYKEKTG